MISIKKYLDSPVKTAEGTGDLDSEGMLPVALSAYRSALTEMGNCSLEACPGLGTDLKNRLDAVIDSLADSANRTVLETADKDVQEQLQKWGRRTVEHYQQTSDEVKELLMAMAKAAESVGSRDERCATQIKEVTDRLTAVATLDDLTQVRASIKRSTADLKISIERMTTEGKVAVEELRRQVSNYQTKLEEAEKCASRDSLTGLRSRVYIERQIERRLASRGCFCVAMVDIDAFKKVNDEHGHLTGDELLKQFAKELASACRSGDDIGRWGGDEFLLALDCDLSGAQSRTERLRQWVCGNYTLQGNSGAFKLRVDASFGVAQHIPGETMNELLARADKEMYRQKRDRD